MADIISIIKTQSNSRIILADVRNHLESLVGSLENPNRNLSLDSREKIKLKLADMIVEILFRLRISNSDNLFEACRVCIDYQEFVSSLDVTTVDIKHMWDRSKMINSLVIHNKFHDVEKEAKLLFEQIDRDLSWFEASSNQLVLPRLTRQTRDINVVLLVMSVAFNVLIAWRSKKEDYSEIFSFFQNCKPWLRLVQRESFLVEKYNQMRTWMENFVRECTMLLVKKRDTEEMALTIRFCTETFFRYGNASVDYDIMLKFSRDLSNSYFSKLDDDYFSETSMIEVMLENMAKESKKNRETMKHFMELVGDCVVNYRGLIGDHCITLANFLFELTETHFAEVKHVRSFIEHFAIALVISDYDACEVWFKVNSIKHVLVELDRYLKSSADIHELKEPRIAGFFCEQLSTMIVSQHQNLLCQVDDTLHIPVLTSEEVFSCYIEDFFCNSECERNEHVVKAALSFFVLALATKEDNEPSKMITKLMKEGASKADLLESTYQNLHKIFEVYNNAERFTEAIEFLKPCCDTAWTHVRCFCKILNTDDYCVSDKFLDDNSMDDLVKRASQDSALLISLLNQYPKEDLDSIVITCVQGWINAYKEFEIPSPVAIVDKWVGIQYDKLIEEKDLEVPTIYALVSELQSKNHSCGITILETELEANKNMYYENSTASSETEKTINKILSKIRTGEDTLRRSDRLVFGGLRLLSCGTKGQSESIDYISRAIDLMTNDINLENHQEDMRESFCHVLFKAYCSRALCRRVAFPKSERFIGDIEALNIWMKQKFFQELTSGDIDMAVFLYIADLLSLEGHMELYSEMIRCIVGSGRTSDDLWSLCWQSGSLSHGLCVSALDEKFIQILADHSSLCEEVTFWENCVQSEPLKVGVGQIWSLLPTISHNSQKGPLVKTIDEVNRVATSLDTSGVPSKDSFAVSRLYFDLAEKLIANGLMIEALSFANKVYKMRWELLSKCFDMKWEGEGAEVTIDDDTFKIQNSIFQNFRMHPERVSPRGSYGVGTGNCIYVPTPWNIVRCYLESALQTAAIHDIMGNGYEAEKILAFGKNLSSKLNLPVFLVQFSTDLGKIYHTKKFWKLALQELDYAEKQLHNTSISCIKCNLISKAKINQIRGDIYLKASKNGSGGNALDLASKFYEIAKSNLESTEWENDISLSKESAKPTIVFCKAFSSSSGITIDHASEIECWHCQPSVIEKSLSLKDHTNMKWEYTRRSLFLRLLSRLGKCARLKGDNSTERKNLMSSICMLFQRSTFEDVVLSSSLLEDLVKNNVVADAFGFEHASILYNICCFSLTCLLNEDKDARTQAILSRTTIVRGLKLAFILSREVPTLHQKVSRLLHVVCAKNIMLSSVDVAPSLTQWATYFHQASVGTNLNHHLLSQETEHVNVHDSDHSINYALAPQNVMKLEEYVMQFYKALPSTAIMCISLLKDNSDKLFQKLLSDCPTSTWILLSRLSVNNEPVCIILPIHKTFIDYSSIEGNPTRWWKCPWADKVFDKVAPLMKRIIEESIRLRHEEDSKHKLEDLDSSLQIFLRGVEDSWLGPWKQILLGQWSECTRLDDIIQELKCVLEKDKHITDVDASYLKLVIQGAGNEYHAEPMMELLLTKGCFIGGSQTKKDKGRLKFIFGEVKNALKKIQLKKYQCREPVIIVPDLNIQMLPWESLPVLRKKEVYRMPSVGFILHRTCANKEVPTMDPRNCYYLINAASNLRLQNLETVFKRWSKLNLGIQGDDNTVPPLHKLKKALTDRELFVYVGHSCGRVYIPSEEIRKIKNCACALLMGCDSGYISYSKTRTDGAPLDYLLAGSNVVAGNLWTVFSNDMQRLTTAIFGSWVRAKSAKKKSCNECMRLDEGRTSRKRKLYEEDSKLDAKGTVKREKQLKKEKPVSDDEVEEISDPSEDSSDEDWGA